MSFREQAKSRLLIGKMSVAIQRAIDTIVQEEDYSVSYAEINAALIDAMKSMNDFALRDKSDAS